MDKSQYIKIQNFRCFKELEVNGFKRVNLIGGKNNAGKTSLLEALLIYFYPIAESIRLLKENRKEYFNAIRKAREDAWNSIFYGQNIEGNTSIEGYFKNIGNQTIKVSTSHSQVFADEDEIDDNLPSPTTILEIEQILNEEKSVKRRLIPTKNGLNVIKSDHRSDYKLFLPFLPSSTMSNHNYGINIAKQYDKIHYNGKSEEVLKILKILDPSITGLVTYSFVEPTLYIQSNNQPRGLPISLFGDAVYRVTAIILELLNQDHKVLFIDEIENGIHYTNQQSFWQGLFTLAEELDTLIFATTHSLEMIKAFAEAGKQFPDQGAYFELAYSPRTDNIVAINRDIDLLEYDLEHGKAIRGE
jgi:predicted ATP-dependent endonuclease of OLD family